MAVMLKDIAEKAGVSPTTVSLVLNPHSKHRISEKTQQRILEIAEELGYHPEDKKPPKPQEIETIVSDIPLSIGLVISNIMNPFFTETPFPIKPLDPVFCVASVIQAIANRHLHRWRWMHSFQQTDIHPIRDNRIYAV